MGELLTPERIVYGLKTTGDPQISPDGSMVARLSGDEYVVLDPEGQLAIARAPKDLDREGTRLEVLAPLVRGRKGEFRDLFEDARRKGFVRVRVDGELYDLEAPPKLNRYENHEISAVVDRLAPLADVHDRLALGVTGAAEEPAVAIPAHGQVAAALRARGVALHPVGDGRDDAQLLRGAERLVLFHSYLGHVRPPAGASAPRHRRGALPDGRPSPSA
mgnify:CR=1 FL=1